MFTFSFCALNNNVFKPLFTFFDHGETGKVAVFTRIKLNFESSITIWLTVKIMIFMNATFSTNCMSSLLVFPILTTKAKRRA